MKKLTILFAVCTGFIFASCGGGKVDNTPEAVLEAFVTKLKKADYSGAKKYATKGSQEGLEAMESMAELSKMGGKEAKDDKMKNAKIEYGKPVINGDEATIPVTADGKTTDWKLKKEDGNWKVDFNKTDMGKGNSGDKTSGSESGLEKIGEGMEKAKDALNSPEMQKAMEELKDPKNAEKLEKAMEEAKKMAE